MSQRRLRSKRKSENRRSENRRSERLPKPSFASRWLSTAVSWNTVTKKKLYWLIGIGVVMYIFIFYMMDKIPLRLRHMIEECIIQCKTKLCSDISKRWRDDGYFFTYESGKLENCIFTVWELTHLIMHVFLGYFFNLQISLGLSVGFEIWEHYVFDCGSYLDLGWNFLGFVIGNTIKTMLNT